MIGLLETVSITDLVIIAAMIAVAVKWIADLRGWTRSTALVRQENSDLRERNATLVGEIERLDLADREKGEKIAALEALVAELQKRDQAAVLLALESHELHAESRSQRTLSVLTEIRDAVIQHGGITP